MQLEPLTILFAIYKSITDNTVRVPLDDFLEILADGKRGCDFD